MNCSRKKKPERVFAPIRGDESYSLQLLRAITGWGDTAMRSARASGLRPIYLHGRVFYSGCSVMAHIHGATDGQAITPSHRGGADDGR